MLFTNRSLTNYPNIIFDNTQLSFVENHKHLGVYINSKGKWDKHIDYIINKYARSLGLMRSMKFKMSRMSLNKMHLSYIRPIIEYANVLWDGCSNENESRIEKVQLEAARLVSGLTRSTSTNKIYQEIGWKTLHRRRKEKKNYLPQNSTQYCPFILKRFATVDRRPKYTLPSEKSDEFHRASL